MIETLTRVRTPRPTPPRAPGGTPLAKLILDYVYDNESAYRDRVYLTQPTGGGAVTDYA